MMDCKKALAEAGGDVEEAIKVLRVKQGKKIADRGERVAGEGTIQTYVHSNAKVAAMVEIDCETDFVARNPEFVEFARQVALHVASAAPRWVSEDDVEAAARDAERQIFEQEAADKPEGVRERIVEGKLKSWYKQVVLLDQPHVNTDKFEGRTIGELLNDQAAKTGENLVIRRFQRFVVGE
jgi:elongation factor Ts